jgi:hypothetical protein
MNVTRATTTDTVYGMTATDVWPTLATLASHHTNPPAEPPKKTGRLEVAK